MDQQPSIEPGRFDFGDYFRLVLWSQRLHGLDFDQYPAVDGQGGVENSKVFTTENNLELSLINGCEAGLLQRERQNLLIHALEETVSKLVDDLKAYADNLFRQTLMPNWIPVYPVHPVCQLSLP